MPVPTAATFSTTALAAAHTALRNLIDAGAGPGRITLRDAAGAALAVIPLAVPCGTVDAVTGQLVFTPAGREESATAGTCAYAEISDGSGAVHLSLPAIGGAAEVSGVVVLNSVVFSANVPVEVFSASVG